ncbi:MAG: ComF family protein [Acidobacteria bacterium]|nr:ComF family protein [Acidobacteriota bacterium]
MRSWLDGLIAILLAPTCAACARPLPHPTRGCVCDACWASVLTIPEPQCRRCGDTLDGRFHGEVCVACARRPSPIDQARAIGPYGGTLRDIVHALKYDGRRSLARPLAARMKSAATPFIADVHVAVPVPLHRSRRRSRGFNQAADLARHLGLPMVHALARTRATDTQTALPADARHANVAGAFRLTRRGRALAGRGVLLVDDVRTTGATLEACAEVLKRAGVTRVCAVTAARVETPQG